ncbi:protein tyrosine phosphatase [Hyphomicrobium sp. NDB2Meth4]|uniref:tyrosine phosphatase family protein n=1 Tax=Hyphomicrobium sp. NDB2Meth4 TaxID=1892846 RepID=UPI000B3128B5
MMKGKASAAVHVCALRHIPDVLRQTGATHLVSAINADLAPQTPAGFAAERHLRLDMHDIIEPCDGASPPGEAHVGALLDFVERWDREAPLLIHCYAGLSRSTAAAFITLCALNPGASEQSIAQALRRASDTAVPNRRFVGLADAYLGRAGRMVAALDSMGPNRIAAECVPFGLFGHELSKHTDRAA